MSAGAMPNYRFFDDEERELENLDRSTALSKKAQESILAPFRVPPKRAVTMRLSESTIAGLKAEAEDEGIPCQTLVSIILEKYVKGSLLDVSTAKKMIALLRDGLASPSASQHDTKRKPSGKGPVKGTRSSAKTKKVRS